MRPTSNHDEFPLSRGRKSDESLSLEPKTYGIILRTPTPKDHARAAYRPPTEKTYALDLSMGCSPQSSKLNLPCIDSVEPAPYGTTNSSDVNDFLELFSCENSSTHSIQSKPLKKVYPPTTYVSFKSSQDKSSKGIDSMPYLTSVSFDEDLVGEGVDAIRSFSLTRVSKDDLDDDMDQDHELLSHHSGLISVDITTHTKPKGVKYSRQRSKSRDSQKYSKSLEKLETIGVNLELDLPSLIFSSEHKLIRPNKSRVLNELVNPEKSPAKGEPIMNRTNKMNVWRDKKHMKRYGSTAVELLSTDPMFAVRNQKIVRDALNDYAGLSPKWYSNMRNDRPLMVKAKKKTIITQGVSSSPTHRGDVKSCT